MSFISDLKYIIVIFFVRIISSVCTKRVEEVYIVKYDKLGDFVLGIPILNILNRYLDNKYINIKKTICIRKINQQLINMLSMYDDVFAIDNLDFRSFLRFVRQTMHKKYKMFIMPFLSTYSMNKFFIRVINADVKIYSVSDAKHITIIEETNGSKKVLLQLTKPIVSEIDYNTELIKAITNDNSINNEIADLRSFAHKKEMYFDNNYFIVNVGTIDSYRQWNINNYASLIQCLLSKYNINCILSGTKEYIDLTKRLFACFCANDKKDNSFDEIIINGNHVKNLVGKTTFNEYLDLVYNSRFIVTDDTGMAHVAPALRVKSFVIAPMYWGTRFYPYNVDINQDELPTVFYSKKECANCAYNMKNVDYNKCDCILSKKDKGIPNEELVFDCIKNIKVDDVIKEVEKFIGERNEKY